MVPCVVRRLSFGQVQEEDVPGLSDGPFPWENMFGFHLAGIVGHDFFKPYAMTFDFENMKIFLQEPRPRPENPDVRGGAPIRQRCWSAARRNIPSARRHA